MRQQLIGYLERCVQREELNIPDLELAADQLIELAGVTIRDRALFLGPKSVDKDLLRRVNHSAVAMFLSCYGTGQASLADVAEMAE